MSDILLSELPKTQFSGLDYQNIIEDITRLVVDNPEYNETWEDFLSGNAGRMMIELFAYIADQLATRIDWVVNENFISTATQRDSVARILKLIGYSFSLPESAVVSVSISLNRPVGTYTITEANDNQGNFSPFSLTAKDKSGTTRTFEALIYDETNTRFEYGAGSKVEIETGTSASPILDHTVLFYEGQTIIDEFTCSDDNNPTFSLSRTPVTENSVRVYLVQGTGASQTETELLLVNSFLDPEAQQTEDTFSNEYQVPYLLNNLGNDDVTIEFGPTSLLPLAARRLRVGDKVRVFYRIGGGADGNIVTRAINTTRRLSINGVLADVTFTNTFAATGGQDSETLDYAKNYGPLQVRTSNKTVTENDYDITLNSISSIIKAKSYGNANLPSTLYDIYNLYIRPLEVWNYIVAAKPGWEDVLPSRYNDFRWITLREENRFNGIYYFRDGIFNESFTRTSTSSTLTLDHDGDGVNSTFRNYYTISPSSTFINSIYSSGSTVNTDFRAKITTEEITDEYFYNIELENYLDPRKGTNSATLDGSVPALSIEEKTRARYLGSEDLGSGVGTIGDHQYLALGFDSRGVIDDINLVGDASLDDVKATINTTFENSTSYGALTLGTTLSADNITTIDVGTGNVPAIAPSSGDLRVVDDNGVVRDLQYSAITGNQQYFTITTTDGNEDFASVNATAGNSVFLTDGETKGYQEFVMAAITPGDPAGLSINTDYYFRVNGEDYTFNSGSVYGKPTFTELASLMKEATKITFKADTTVNNNVLTNVEPKYLYQLKKGMQIGAYDDGVATQPFITPAVTIITDINLLTREVTLSTDDGGLTDTDAASTQTQWELYAYPFEIELTAGNIVGITNLQFEPYGPLWIENGQDSTSENNLLTNTGFIAAATYTGLNTTVAATGTSGYQEMGINGVINETAGYNTLTNNTDPGTATYYFSVEYTNSDVTSAGYVPDGSSGSTFSITTTGSNTASEMSGLINTAIDANNTYTLATTLSTAGVTTIDVGVGNLPATSPTSEVPDAGGYIRVVDDDGNERLIHYTSHDTQYFTVESTDFDGISGSGYGTATAGNSVIMGFVYTEVDENGKIRFTNYATGADSTAEVVTNASANSPDVISPTYFGVDSPISGEDVGETGLTATTDYTFNVNDYEFTLTTGATTTYLDLVIAMNSAMSGSSYTATVTGTQWNEDIRITHNSSGWVNLKEGTTTGTETNLYDSIEILRIVSEAKSTGLSWSAFETAVGGGDYRYVADYITGTSETNFFLQSPSYGEFSSMVTIQEPTTSTDGTTFFFGILSTALPVNNYGIKRATIITDQALSNFGTVIIENGSTRIWDDSETLYLHYLNTDTDELILGTYFNENFESTDPSWREAATRIYNTSYDASGEVDIANSDFIIKVTSEPTEEMSLYSIDNTWTFELSSPASVDTVANPHSQIVVGVSDFIKIAIDGGTAVEIDLSAVTTLGEFTEAINNALQTEYSTTFTYAISDSITGIVTIRSSINTNSSSVVLTPPTSQDATLEVFGLVEYASGYTYSYYNTGDYYLEYDAIPLQGDFTFGSATIADVKAVGGATLSSTEWSKISVGTRILPISGVISEAFVVAFDESLRTITMNVTAAATSEDQAASLSRDYMIMKRVINNNTISNIPDGKFYVHFIFDKRYVEDSFDGATSSGFQSPGFPLGSLDEDVYSDILADKKIVGITNVFKQPKITTFDIAATIYYNKIYSSADVEERVEEGFTEAYGLENRDFGQSVNISKILSLIHENAGVEYVQVSFLGTDYTDSSTEVEGTITARFDEILVLSEDVFLGGTQSHGLIFTYQVSGD